VDGYFIAPHTVMDALAEAAPSASNPDEAWKVAATLSETQVRERLNHLLSTKGTTTAEEFHKELGQTLYIKCGLSRNRADMEAARRELLDLQERFRKELLIPGTAAEMNFELEKAGRVEDYLEMALLITEDALQREESCGAHFREEYQTADGEALRNDQEYKYVSAWEYKGNNEYILHKEHLNFEYAEVKERSYK